MVVQQEEGKLVSLNCRVLFYNPHMYLQSSLSPFDFNSKSHSN